MDSIPVCIRARPLYERERVQGEQECWRITSDSIISNQAFGNTSFTFDRCFEPKCTTAEVYTSMGQRIIESAMSGYNGTIFCYGQTSSGKTHTMYGTEENPGFVRLAAREIYSIIQSTPDREYLVCASMVEVYNENIRDLLGRKPARIREDCYGRITLEADKKAVSTPEQVLAVLRDGERQASRATTNMNDMSSRSHTIFRLYIESKARTADDEFSGEMALQSELNLVDLAGSECAAMTGAEGSLRREGAFINKSLLALSTVIEKLSSVADKKAAPTFINFRDSTLTRMLQSSLGGNSKTAIICNVSLAPGNFSQTNSTLMFASRAKKIQNSAKINEVTDDKTELKKCKREIGELKKQLSLHEAKLSEVAFQTILNERDEKVRDLQAEREQLARKLEACMKMISVSNQQPAMQPKPEQFNRRFTLACSSVRNFLLSPIKPPAVPFEAPDWSGRPCRLRRGGESTSTYGDIVDVSGVEPPERDPEAVEPLMLVDGGSERGGKKRKWSSGEGPQPWPRLDAAAQTDATGDDTALDNPDGRLVELETLLQAASMQCSSLQAALLDAQHSRDQLMEQAARQVDEMARQHQAEVQRLQGIIAGMEQAEERAAFQAEEQLQQLHREVKGLKAQQRASATEQRMAELHQQLNVARMAQEDQRALAAAAAEEAQRRIIELEGLIGGLTSQLEQAQGAVQRMHQADTRDIELERMHAELQVLKGLMEERSVQLTEAHRALGQHEHELRALRAQEADLRAQLAIGALGSEQEAQAEAVQELELEVRRLTEECAQWGRTVQERDTTIAALSTECIQKEAQLQTEQQVVSHQQTSLTTIADQLEEQRRALDAKSREVVRLQCEVSMNAELQQGLQARLAELTASLDQAVTLQRHQEEALVASQQECIAIRQAQAQQAVHLQARLTEEAEGASQLHLAVQQRDTRVAELEGKLAAAQQEAREGFQQLAMAREQLAQCESDNLQITQRLVSLQGALEEQEAVARSRAQELEERITAADSAQESHQAELQWWKEQVAQRDGQLQTLQEETESLRLQHGALLREMGTVAPALAGARKLPPEKLRDDNVAMQKQLTALKNDVLLKDRKLKAFEKGQEGRAKEMEKLQARVKAADEMLKQLRQEKGAVVQELVKKDAEVKDCKRKLERVDKESEKFTATLKVERDRLRQVQEELAAVQKVLHGSLLERQQLTEADEARRAELNTLRDTAAQREAALKEREERLQGLLQTELTLNTNLTEMAAMHQKALLDHQAAVQRGDALAAQLQAVEGRLVRQTEESKQTLEEMQNRLELLQQQLNDTNELQEILTKEKQGTEAALLLEAEEARRLTLAKAVLEQQLQERTTECEAIQAAQQHAEAALEEEQRLTLAQRHTIEELQAGLAQARCEAQGLQEACTRGLHEIEGLRHATEASEGERVSLGQRLRATEQELLELREQHEETETELAKANTRVLELETDRDTWQMENDNLREELEEIKNKLQNCLSQAEQATEEFHRRKVDYDSQLEQLRAELNGRSNDLRASQLELGEKKKAVMMLEAEVQRLEAEWKADVQGYIREFAEKERHFAKISAENQFLSEELETFQAQAQQRGRDLEEMSSKHEETCKAHAGEMQALQEQLEEASRQRRIAVARLEKELGEARTQVARIPGLQQELQVAHQQGEAAQATVDHQQLQLQGLRDTLQQKDAELTLAESLASDLRGEVDDWRLRLLQKEGELAEALAKAAASDFSLKASQAKAVDSEASVAEKEDQLAQAHARLAAAEELASRREKVLQGLQQEMAELKRERSAAQLAMAQKEGETEGLKGQLQRGAEQRRQLEVLAAQREAELAAARQQHAEQVQQLSSQLGDVRAALAEAHQEAAATTEQLAQAREACSNLEMALSVDRRAHQRKVEQLEEMIQCAKERVAQTEHASESEKVVHRRQTMVITTTESQLRHLQAEKDQLETTLLEAQRSLQAMRAQEVQAASVRQQMQEAQDELHEELTYLRERIKIFEASLSDAGQVEKGLREKLEKMQEEMTRQRQKHEKAMRKLKDNAETRYQMLKEKALDRLDRYKRDSVNRRSLTPADLLGKENPSACTEKVRIVTEPLNLTEGERRIPRRTSLSRTPFAVRVTADTPKAESDSDTEPEKDVMADNISSNTLDVFASPHIVRWALDGTQ